MIATRQAVAVLQNKARQRNILYSLGSFLFPKAKEAVNMPFRFGSGHFGSYQFAPFTFHLSPFAFRQFTFAGSDHPTGRPMQIMYQEKQARPITDYFFNFLPTFLVSLNELHPPHRSANTHIGLRYLLAGVVPSAETTKLRNQPQVGN